MKENPSGNERLQNRFVVVEIDGMSPEYKSKPVLGNLDTPKDKGEPLYIAIDIDKSRVISEMISFCSK